MKRALFIICVSLQIALGWGRAGPAWAQPQPQVRLSADAEEVGLGETVHVTLEASSEDQTPSNPKLFVPSGVRIRGQTTMPTHSVSIVNGVRSERRGLSVTWTLEGERAGAYRVGPATVFFGATTVATHMITVRFAPPGQAPQRSPRPGLFPPGFSPFDPWRGLLQGLDDDSAPFGLHPTVSTDPKLALDKARGDTAFLHAMVDKTSAVVGEQVTLTVYLYIDMETAGDPDFGDVHEAAAADFVKRSLLDDETSPKAAGNALVDGRVYAVRLVRKSALFPLKAGELDIGPMSLAVARRRGAPGSARTSEPLRVRVSEPPVAGRPPGYSLGDVGRFVLGATVSPRDIERDGAVSVNVELSGTGNLPATLTPPERAGVEWLEPQVRDKLGAVDGVKFGGKRDFAFVARSHRPGDVDLGEFRLAYWDPEAQRYGVTRAPLGRVHVTDRASPPAEAPQQEGLAAMPAPRERRAEPRPVERHATDTPLFWLALAAAPLSYSGFSAGRSALRALRRRRASSTSSPEAELRDRTKLAALALDTGDARALDAATARALTMATAVHAGVKVQGLALSDVAARLQDGGIASDVASGVARVLAACDAARFSPDSADLEAARARWAEARRLIAALRRGA